jgi:enterochelin esterase-like enzyme
MRKIKDRASRNMYRTPSIMKIYCLVITHLLFSSIAYTQTFEHFLKRVGVTPDSLKMNLVDSFMSINKTSPYLEQDTLAHILFRGNFQNLGFKGDVNYWNHTGDQFTCIEGTNFWYYSLACEPDARIDYKIVLNESDSILDPLNPHIIWGGFGPNSELRMPRYIPSAEIEYYADIPHGSLLDTNFYSINLKNSRIIKLYLPPDYHQSEETYDLVLFQDGLDYLTLANARNILDYLIWQQRIVPVIALFIPAVNRADEYAGNLKTAYCELVVGEILPWVDSQFRTKSNPESRVTIGCSAGGNISLWLGLHYPEIFGNVAAQSSYVEESISLGFKETSHTRTKFYLDMGVYDVPILPPLVDHLVQILHKRNFEYRYQYYPEGHSWGSWRAHIDDVLEMFFPGPAFPTQSSR